MVKLNWMHPSYRDLVIEELIINRDLRNQFLFTANLRDIGLALSDTGGPDGQRKMPLIVDDESKNIIFPRFVELTKTLNEVEVASLLDILDNAIRESGSNNRWLLNVLKEVLACLIDQWNGRDIIISSLATYCRVTLHLRPLPQLPNFEPTLNEIVKSIDQSIQVNYYLEDYLLDNLASIISLLQKNEPRLLHQIDFPKTYKLFFENIVQNLAEDAHSELLAPTQDEIKGEIERFDSLIASLENLGSVVLEWNSEFLQIIQLLVQKKEGLEASITEEPTIDNYDDDYHQDYDIGFDIDRLFLDL